MNKEDLTKALKDLGIVTYGSEYGSYFIVGKYLFSNAHVFENSEEMQELEFEHSWSFTQTKFFRPVSEKVPDIAVAELESSVKSANFKFFDAWSYDQSCYCFINPMLDPTHKNWLTVLEGTPINTRQNPITLPCANELMPLGLSGAPLLHAKRKIPEGDKPFWQVIPVGVIYAKDEKNDHLYAVSLQAEMQEILNLLQKRDEDEREEQSHTYQPTLPQKASILEPAFNAYQSGHLSNASTFVPIATGLTLLRKPKLTKTKLAILNDAVRIENGLSNLETFKATLNILLIRLLNSFSEGDRVISKFKEKEDQTDAMRIDFERGPRILCFEDNMPDHDHEKSSRFLAVKFDPSINTIQKDSLLKALFYSALFLQTIVICIESPNSLEKENKSAQPKNAKKTQQKQKKEKTAAHNALKKEEKRTSKPHFEIFMHPNGNLHLDASNYSRYNKKENNPNDRQINPSIQVIKSLFCESDHINQKNNQSFINKMKTLTL